MKTLVILLSLMFVSGTLAGETYKERRTRKLIKQSGYLEQRRHRIRDRKTIIFTEVYKKGNTITEYDYGINQYRVYEFSNKVNTDPIPSPLSPINKSNWPWPIREAE